MCRDDSYSTIVSCLNADLRRRKKISTSGWSLPLGRHRAVSMSIEFSENYPWLGDFQESLGFFLKWTCYRYSPYFSHQKTRVFLAISNSSQGFPTFFPIIGQRPLPQVYHDVAQEFARQNGEQHPALHDFQQRVWAFQFDNSMVTTTTNEYQWTRTWGCTQYDSPIGPVLDHFKWSCAGC